MKHLKSFFAVTFSVLSFSLYAQTTVVHNIMAYGGNKTDRAIWATRAYDGGFVVTMLSYSDAGTGSVDSLCSIGGEKFVFMKYNANATALEWTKCCHTSGDTTLLWMFAAPGGGGVFFGLGNAPASGGLYICRQDAAGSIVWSHWYSRENFSITDVKATSDGGYIAVGTVYYVDSNFSLQRGGGDIGVIKLDGMGNKMWSKVIGGSKKDEGSAVMEGNSGEYYIGGATLSNDFDCTGLHSIDIQDYYLAKLDNNGNVVWHRDLGGTNYEDIYNWLNICSDGKGGVIAAGLTNSSDGDVHHHIGGADFWALSVDSNGNILWDNCYGSVYDEYGVWGLCRAADGSIWISGDVDRKEGQIADTFGSGDAWFVHTDSVGNLINARVLGSAGRDQGDMVYPLANSFVMGGGNYGYNSGSFTSCPYYGEFDAFLTIFKPWSTGGSNISGTIAPLHIFPNPASNVLHISVDVKDGGGTISIYDVYGRCLFSKQVPVNVPEMDIDVRAFAKGIYYVQMIGGDGCRNMQKLVIE